MSNETRRDKIAKPASPARPTSPKAGKTTPAASKASKGAPAVPKAGKNTPATPRSGKSTKAPLKKPAETTRVTPQQEDENSLLKKLTGLPGAVASGAMRLAEVPLKVSKALFLKPEQAAMMEEAGHTLRDLREVAGLTRDELSEALDLKDRSLLEAVENGTAVLSFELILRLAAVLSRHDPIPVVLKFTRSYNPELWKVLQDWGLGRISLNFEREREFINIYRRHDAARQLSDQGFARVLEFTRSAFDMALHFVAEQEDIEESDEDEPDEEEND